MSVQLKLELDHLVVAAANLADGVEHSEAALGVKVPPGGAHPLMGTHNHLISIGSKGTPQSCFLEVIAPDPAAIPQRRRWFGLDAPPAAPRLGTWIVRTDDIDEALRALPFAAHPAIVATRGDLKWRITVPDDGSMPFDGAFPTIIEWPEGPLPPDGMHDAGCSLTKLIISHPRALEIERALAPYLADARIEFASARESGIAAHFDTPLGARALS